MCEPSADLLVERFDLAQERAALGVGFDFVLRFDDAFGEPVAQRVACFLQDRYG